MNSLNPGRKEAAMPLSEQSMQFLEEHIPELAQSAVTQAYWQALQGAHVGGHADVDLFDGEVGVRRGVTHVGGMQAEILNQAIREDVDLRETTLWRIFGVPGTRRVNLAYLERYRGEPGEGWESSIQTLVAEGTLSQERVAQACTDALTRSFSPAETAWFRRLRSKITRL